MRYYKVSASGSVIGVGTDYDLFRYLIKDGRLVACDLEQAEYIIIKELLYHANWFRDVVTDTLFYQDAKVTVIEKDEYDVLLEAMEANEEITEDDGDELSPSDDYDVIPPDTDYTSLEYVVTSKVNEMSRACNQEIVKGCDVVLSDGESHHFSLTIHDQLNLISLQSMVNSGADYVPYHADDELCKEYPAQDIINIVNAAAEYKTYHVTYFNSLKAYIESLDTMQAVSDIYYGVPIPVEYQSSVLQEILASMNRDN